MKNKLIIFATVLTFGLAFAACEEDYQEKVTTRTSAMTGAQQVPAVTTSATGRIDYTYNSSNKVLSYSVTWSGLTDSATTMTMNGPALRGQTAANFQAFTFNAVQRRKEGTYTGNLLIDGAAIKVEDLFAGKYYITLRSKAFTNGELRGQLEF